MPGSDRTNAHRTTAVPPLGTTTRKYLDQTTFAARSGGTLGATCDAMTPSMRAESSWHAPIVRIPSRATSDAGRLLADIGPTGVACESAIDQIINAIENDERVRSEHVHAAAERMLCGDLGPERARRLASALANVRDQDLTEALVTILGEKRVEGDDLLIECALRVLHGSVHRRYLTLTQRRLVSAQAHGRTRPVVAPVIHLHPGGFAKAEAMLTQTRSKPPALRNTSHVNN